MRLGYTRRDAMQPLTQLSPDEQLFRSTVRDFARTEIAPLVRKMDEEQHFDAGLLRKLHGLGFHGHPDSRGVRRRRGLAV